MDLGTVMVAVVVLGGLALAYNFAGRGAQALGGLFHPPGLGWPHGVQEDDDLRWRWSAALPPSREPAAGGPPATIAAQRVRGTLHRGSSRSAGDRGSAG